MSSESSSSSSPTTENRETEQFVKILSDAEDAYAILGRAVTGLVDRGEKLAKLAQSSVELEQFSLQVQQRSRHVNLIGRGAARFKKAMPFFVLACAIVSLVILFIVVSRDEYQIRGEKQFADIATLNSSLNKNTTK